MNSKFNDYLKKKTLLESLREELAALENDPEYQQVTEVNNELDTVMAKFGLSLSQLKEIVDIRYQPIHTSFQNNVQKAKKDGRSRARHWKLKRYTNPHTNEKVHAKSPNNGRVQEWIREYGKDTVAEWAEVIDEAA